MSCRPPNPKVPRGGVPAEVFLTTASRMRHFGARFFDAVRGRGPLAPLFTAPAQAGSPRLREGGPIRTKSHHSARGVDASGARFFDAVDDQGAPAPLFTALAQNDSPSLREVRPKAGPGQPSPAQAAQRSSPEEKHPRASRFAQIARGRADSDGKWPRGTRRRAKQHPAARVATPS